jgi:hypothetical protein
MDLYRWIRKHIKAKKDPAEEKVDRRSEEEKQLEAQCAQPLDEADEAAAQYLYRLLERSMRTSNIKSVASLANSVEIQEIGRDLGRHGGKIRMKRVAYRVMTLGGSMRLIDMYWDGLRDWKR